MMRAGLYARFSSDLQSESSIADQFALCRVFCEREGFAVVSEHSDRAISGASIHGRHGLAGLLTDAKNGRCDVIVVEALDRLSRDMGDLSNIWKEANFAGVPIIAVHDGKADQIQIGVRGLVGALYLTDLANKTRRGLAGKLRAGQRAGGLPYGYRPIPGRPGEHEICEPEAAIVRRIFMEYGSGSTPREIAQRLNIDKIEPYRGRAWNASTINGNAKRTSGILANEIYRGVIVWNKVGKMKNPATGKRVPRINPQSEWQRADAPHLRIVEEELWQSVQVQMNARRRGPHTMHRAPKRLLSGLLKCPSCGSGMVSAGNDHGRPVARCSRVRESGDCDNRGKIYLDTIEHAVIATLREQLAHPKAIAEAVREYHAEMRRLDGEREYERAKDQRRLAECRRQIERAVDQIVDGIASGPAIGRRLAELEAEAAKIEEKLAGTPSPDVITLHPKALEQYLSAIDTLSTSIAEGRDVEALRLLRGLVNKITVYPRRQGEPLRFDITGNLIALLDPSVGSLVPRGGFEPPTRGFSVRCSTN